MPPGTVEDVNITYSRLPLLFGGGVQHTASGTDPADVRRQRSRQSGDG
jgi:hypothetical protein